jgi:prolyl-tRNA editing enzyme YbaK/EbsC (Cys-tRNA(Pro) deacylase)
VSYYETDVEYEEFPEESNLTGKADFVCASFGMPSFVEDTVAMLRRFYKWLRPGGRVLFTFYNARSLALTVPTSWKDRALSATIDLVRHALEVEIREDVRFSIFCRPMDDRVLDFVKAMFSIEHFSTFPHVMSILPPTVFGTDEKPQPIAREIFSKVDRAVANDSNLGRGHYVFIIARKDGLPMEGYLRILRALEDAGVPYELIEHGEVVSTREVGELLALSPEVMIKTVVFKVAKTERFLVVLVPANKQVDLRLLSEAAGVAEPQVVLAPQPEIEAVFGFPIGGVAPIGLPERVEVFMDKTLRNLQGAYMYMGVGDNRKTLKLDRESFMRVTEAYVAIDLVQQSLGIKE